MRTLLPVLLLLPVTAFGWGFAGHRRLASMLQDPLPTNHCLRTWYSARQTSALQNRACDPDRWRLTSDPNYDPNEWFRHYLEVDRISPTSAYPRSWADVVALFPNYYNDNGRVPWRVEEMYGQLVAAFRSGNTATILDVTFLMSHYVTDSFSVLHDTRDFNPGGTLHSRWESDMLEVSSQLNGVASGAVGYYGTVGRADPKNNIFDIVLVGQAIQPQLVQWHNANTDNTAFYMAARDYTSRRWGDALTLMASLVWTAWAEAGAPSLTGFPSGCSMAQPSGEITLRGFPPNGGLTHPDGGTPAPPDSGVVIPDAGPTVDAGCLDGCTEDDAGTGGSGGGTGGMGGASGGTSGGEVAGGAGGGGGEPPQEPPPCGCAGAPGLLALAALALLSRRTTR